MLIKKFMSLFNSNVFSYSDDHWYIGFRKCSYLEVRLLFSVLRIYKLEIEMVHDQWERKVCDELG